MFVQHSVPLTELPCSFILLMWYTHHSIVAVTHDNQPTVCNPALHVAWPSIFMDLYSNSAFAFAFGFQLGHLLVFLSFLRGFLRSHLFFSSVMYCAAAHGGGITCVACCCPITHGHVGLVVGCTIHVRNSARSRHDSQF